MRWLAAYASILAAGLLMAEGYTPEIAYFSNLRSVQTVRTQPQNYIVVDDSVWAHARPDLGDLRLFDGTAQLPYALREQRGGVSSVEQAATVLNLGTVGKHTEFDIDTAGATEYNRIELQLNSKDFVCTAQVEGRNGMAEKHSVGLGTSTLYDFTREKLGSNFVLKLPPSTFRYLHVRTGLGIRPDQVKGASISNLEEKTAFWQSAGTCQPATTREKATTMVCPARSAVPVERVVVEIPPAQVNFRRVLIVEDSAGSEVARGEVSRIRMVRGNQSVINEDLAVALPGTRSSQFTVIVENGDDMPIAFQSVRLQSVERRLYFDPEGRDSVSLYYGDEKLRLPTYDYEKFFSENGSAVEAKLGPDQRNAAYTGRPDDRPWSERHKAVLWLALLFAVAALLAVAVRGLRGAPSTE